MNNNDKLKQSQGIVKAANQELSAHSSISHNPKRRALLGKTLAYAGAAGAAGLAGGNALAQALPIPESNRTMGRTIPPEDYGMPSKYESKVKRRRTDVFVNRGPIPESRHELIIPGDAASWVRTAMTANPKGHPSIMVYVNTHEIQATGQRSAGWRIMDPTKRYEGDAGTRLQPGENK